MESVKNKIRTAVIIFLFSCLLILLFICADTGKLPEFVSNLYSFPFGDKVGHILVMGFFSFIFQFCFYSNTENKKQNAKRIILIALIFAVLITGEEFSQLFFEKRTFSTADLLSSYTGIGIASLINIKLLRFRRFVP